MFYFAFQQQKHSQQKQVLSRASRVTFLIKILCFSLSIIRMLKALSTAHQNNFTVCKSSACWRRSRLLISQNLLSGREKVLSDNIKFNGKRCRRLDWNFRWEKNPIALQAQSRDLKFTSASVLALTLKFIDIFAWKMSTWIDDDRGKRKKMNRNEKIFDRWPKFLSNEVYEWKCVRWMVYWLTQSR